MKLGNGGALLLGIFLACQCLAAQAQVYRWVDAQGRTHMGDQLPALASTPVDELKPRQGNLVKPVRPAPVAQSEASDPQTPNPVIYLGEPAKKTTGVAARQNSCAAEKKAFEASRACYDACVQAACTPSGCYRNLNNCGHCTNLFPPDC